MSNYRYMRVIRCKVDMNKIGVSSIWDLEGNSHNPTMSSA